MNRKKVLFAAVGLVVLTALIALSGGFFGVKLAGRALPNCPGAVFAHEAMVFDAIAICATRDVSQTKLAHAANVAAEWLDNDGDGQADEPRVIAAMKTTRPFVVMTPNGPSAALMAALSPAFGSRVGQDLHASETSPGGEQRDASQEEILHAIQNGGWAVAFPDVWGDQPGSTLYQEWQKAEGAGHYAYDDPTCDSACKVTEYTYVAAAAYHGSAPDLVSNEIRLHTRDALRQGLPGTAAVFESADYRFATDHWPTGRYPHQSNIAYAPNDTSN